METFLLASTWINYHEEASLAVTPDKNFFESKAF